MRTAKKNLIVKKWSRRNIECFSGFCPKKKLVSVTLNKKKIIANMCQTDSKSWAMIFPKSWFHNFFFFFEKIIWIFEVTEMNHFLHTIMVVIDFMLLFRSPFKQSYQFERITTKNSHILVNCTAHFSFDRVNF